MRELWDEFKKTIDSPSFPKFRCNLFIQYKRPELILSPRGKERRYWRSRYYRYQVTDRQQRILSSLEGKTIENALVVYACAAFVEELELWRLAGAGTLVENSNFCRPMRIDGHRKYTFVNAGTRGRAFSEPEDIGHLDLMREIDERLEKPVSWEANSAFIIDLAKLVDEAMTEVPDKLQRIYKLVRANFEFAQDTLAKSIETILAFVHFANLTWMIGYS